MAGLAFCQGLMPAAFITTSSRSESIRLYTNKMAANRDIGDKIVKIRGIRSDVSSAKRPTEMPLLVIRSTNRKDCVSQMIDISEKETSKNPTKICFIMYRFNFFIKGIITKLSDLETKILQIVQEICKFLLTNMFFLSKIEEVTESS